MQLVLSRLHGTQPRFAFGHFVKPIKDGPPLETFDYHAVSWSKFAPWDVEATSLKRSRNSTISGTRSIQHRITDGFLRCLAKSRSHHCTVAP